MEDGLWDKANEEKLRLEEKQRATRRKRENEAEIAASEGKLQLGCDKTQPGHVGTQIKAHNEAELKQEV